MPFTRRLRGTLPGDARPLSVCGPAALTPNAVPPNDAAHIGTIDDMTNMNDVNTITNSVNGGFAVANKTISFTLPEELLAKIDEYGFDVRIRSRNEVMRKLLRDGLHSHGWDSDEDSADSADTASSTDRATR